MDFLNFGPIAKSESDPRQAGPIKAKFVFSAEELQRSPSILSGLPIKEEQKQLQIGCTVIRQIAERLNELQKEVVKISQLCVAVSMIQLRRFFTIHSLKNFDPIDVGAAALFMSTKSEECPRRLEYVVRAWYRLRYELEVPEPKSVVSISKTECEKFGDYIVLLENIILQSIGFNFGINVPHPIVIQLAHLYRPGDKKFHEAVFWLTTDALHATNWAVRYSAQLIGCASFYLAAIWKDHSYVFPPPINGKEWYNRMDPTITIDQLHELSVEFLNIWKDFDKTTHFNMSQFDHKTRPIVLDYGLPPVGSSVVSTPPSTLSQGTSAMTESETSYSDSPSLTLPPPPPAPSFSAQLSQFPSSLLSMRVPPPNMKVESRDDSRNFYGKRMKHEY